MQAGVLIALVLRMLNRERDRVVVNRLQEHASLFGIRRYPPFTLNFVQNHNLSAPRAGMGTQNRRLVHYLREKSIKLLARQYPSRSLARTVEPSIWRLKLTDI